jgi:hypothetical protein
MTATAQPHIYKTEEAWVRLKKQPHSSEDHLPVVFNSGAGKLLAVYEPAVISGAGYKFRSITRFVSHPFTDSGVEAFGTHVCAHTDAAFGANIGFARGVEVLGLRPGLEIGFATLRVEMGFATISDPALPDPKFVSLASMAPEVLTFVAEEMGATRTAEEIVPALLQLLHHQDAAVREGVVYGLSYHLSEDVRSALRAVSENDENLDVRQAARSAISE